MHELIKVEAVSGVKGSIVQLKCPYNAADENKIVWFIKKSETSPATQITDGLNINPSLPSDLKSRLTVTGDHAAGEYHLSISDVRESDAGTYTCILYGTVGVTTLQLNVITNIPTSVSLENVGLDKKLNGKEGQNLIIRCSAVGGNPVPDVKLLISESVVAVSKQSVQYTLSYVNRSHDGQNIQCMAGYEEMHYYPLNDTARIYLKLKPYPPRFSSDSVNTEENKPLVISCTSTGSRPKASIYWLLGDGKTNITAYATQLPPSHDPTTDTYSVTSTLTYSMHRIYNGKYMICGARNEATLEQGGGVETSKTLNITYAPDITVNSSTYTQNDAIRKVICNPSGNPNIYTYHKWQHKSRYGEIIREFNGNKTLTLPDVPVLLRYQDSGEYVCSASNGIIDNENKFKQTGSGLVTVRAQPVFTSDTIDRVKQFGEIHKTVDIYINVISDPKFTSFVWARDGTSIKTQNSAKYQSSSSPTIVKDTIHGKEVQLYSYNVTLAINDLKAEDFVNYTVTLKSGFPDVKFTIALESASIPDIPGNFSQRDTAFTSFTVQWDPGSDGVYKQTFYIQYRVQGSSEWTIVAAGDEDINEQRRRRTYEVRNLQEGKAYELRMYAENTAMKRSNFTDVLIVFTKSSGTNLSTTSSAVIGTVVGVVVTLVIVCASFIVILLIKRSQGKDKKEK
ncbi:Hypothetical predicted protein [Mytilus galloprovincialis]|uniref:Uncharacterized protein n=1 Tax=Mytilus galloprovincialis TaxID=29158 RepID=A0A8B6GKD3_MYTGA|nr:Hypothetical predicted protein [Mytilus galloprovincialis]